MTEKSKIFVDLPEDICITLEDNDLTIESILEDANIEADVKFDALPAENPDDRTLDLVPAIEAGAFIISQAVSIITDVISQLKGRAFETIIYENEIVRDAQGEPILSKNGRVKTIRKRVEKITEQQVSKKSTLILSIKWKEGIEIHSDSEDKY